MSTLIPPEPGEHQVDGRRIRGAKNRQLAATAVLDILRETGCEPSADEVASRAGLSQRTVFRLFGDMDGLFFSAVQVQAERIIPLLATPAIAGPRRHRVRHLASARARLYEEISPVRRVALGYITSRPVIREGIDRLNARLRVQVEEIFAPEIERCPQGGTESLTHSLEAVTSWGTWESLRADQGLTVKAAEALLRRMIDALIDSHCGPEAA
jgi:AcrR family transcriptional regulator